ncbi:META domain-containing protein [Winogradskyella arenosi]|uniref:Heat shock protein HslJ n=1 Tax=Winogradskyella arenosi TaxID=533325 RepID=A0A368ZKP5_9FLAO|nr:META domain-containing protein [Winogradskyella arenosi]RCW93717.1 heat shock protein HslJ [Winogradskyella arenosi]
MKKVLYLFIIILTLSSCNSSKTALEKKDTMPQTIPEATYLITEVKSETINPGALSIAFNPTTGKVTGHGGCNSFFTTYTTEGNEIVFSPIAASKKLCPKAISQLENDYFTALKQATHFNVNGATISFSNTKGPLAKGQLQIEAVKTPKEVDYKDRLRVKYESFSRTDFDFILLSQTQAITSKDKGLQKTTITPMPADDWKALKELIDAIELSEVTKLTPPSTAHQYDGAPHASLAITVGDIEYASPAFDHGNPPKSIEALVNKVLSIKENLRKP